MNSCSRGISQHLLILCEILFYRIQNLSLILPPWTLPSYSNLAYNLIARVLEKSIHRKYEEYVEEEIIKKLGMKRTGFTFTPKVISEMAVGYGLNGKPAPLVELGFVIIFLYNIF